MKKWIAWLSLLSICTFSIPVYAGERPLNQNIRDFDTSSLIKTDLSYWVWGNNQSVPTQVAALTDVVQSFPDQLVMKKDGSVWYWEYTSSGIQIQQMKGLSNIVAVASGWRGSIAYNQTGKVYYLSKTEGRFTPGQADYAELREIDHVVDISSYYDQDSEFHWLFVCDDGRLFQSNEQLDAILPVESLRSVKEVEESIVLQSDGTVLQLKNNRNEDDRANAKGTGELQFASVEGLTGIQKIASKGGSYLAIDGQGRVWFWGVTYTGYSDGTTLNQHPKAIQLSDLKGKAQEVYIVERTLVVLAEGGNVYGTSIDQLASLPANTPWKLIASDVQTIKASTRHMIMMKYGGSLWGYGVNKNGQLGHGDYEFMHDNPVSVQKPVSVEFNGETIQLNNGVIIQNGQAFIPLRSVFEKIGAEIGWDMATKISTLEQKNADPAVSIRIDFRSGEVTKNGEKVTLLNKPFVLQSTAYLPLRFISEALGAKVEWNQEVGKIVISMK
ncbi:stalk domain-containing protein [Paenibacillus terrigena]|uniref:stalk domain-containing protein n=1 Tax=Paenibacillus terrigena TaxID=369333 RepID=UPI00036DF749|nr:stalk domain-containing protein [Paenibacillus terrigena]